MLTIALLICQQCALLRHTCENPHFAACHCWSWEVHANV